MIETNKQTSAGDESGDEKNMKISRSAKRAMDTGLKRATDVYGYIADSLVDLGMGDLGVKTVNTQFTGTRQLLSTVQTVHRLQRDAASVKVNPQLIEFMPIEDKSGNPALTERNRIRFAQKTGETVGK